MRDQGQSIDDVDLTPHHSKVYTEALLHVAVVTVFLAIVILAILTLARWPRSLVSKARVIPLMKSNAHQQASYSAETRAVKGSTERRLRCTLSE